MRAVLDWAGCATFRLTLDDTVVFLDAYLDRRNGAEPTGFSVDTVDRVGWILIGHTHTDHLWGAERIARRTGATIVGSYETVDGEPVQGSLAGFIADEVRLLRPDRLILGHHDDWMPGLTTPVDIGPIRGAVASQCPATDLVELGYRSGYRVF